MVIKERENRKEEREEEEEGERISKLKPTGKGVREKRVGGGRGSSF